MDVSEHDDALMARQLSIYARDFQQMRVKYQELLARVRRLEREAMPRDAEAQGEEALEPPDTGLVCVIDTSGQVLCADEASRRFFGIRPGVSASLSALFDPHEWQTLQEGGSCWVHSKVIDWSKPDPYEGIEMRDLQLIPFEDPDVPRWVLLGSALTPTPPVTDSGDASAGQAMGPAGVLVVDRDGRLLACDSSLQLTLRHTGISPYAWRKAVALEGNEDAVEAFRRRLDADTGSTDAPWAGTVQLRLGRDPNGRMDSGLWPMWLHMRPLLGVNGALEGWALQLQQWSTRLVNVAPWMRDRSSCLPSLTLFRQCVRWRINKSSDPGLRRYLAVIEVQAHACALERGTREHAQALLKSIRGCDMATRLGPNRYLVMLDGNESEFEGLSVIRAIVHHMSVAAPRGRVEVGVWAGYTPLDARDDLFDEWLEAAEAALLKARQGPSGQVCSAREYGHVN